MKKIKFCIKSILRILIGLTICKFIKRDKSICIFGLREPVKDAFMHNTKYLFLYLNSLDRQELRPIYVCDDKKMLNEFKKCGFRNIYSRHSIKGIYYSLKAKYYLYDFHPNCISSIFSYGATLINLWHGVPLKKIENDCKVLDINKLNLFQKFIFNALRVKHDCYIVNSEYESSCYETAFLTSKEKINILGSPRLDVLLHNIPNSNLFMEEDYENIKYFKSQGKKLIYYIPTFRDTGKDISSWLKSDNLRVFLENNNTILVCKLHFIDKNSLSQELTNNFYKMNCYSDIYPLLKYSDALITDYSSIYFDYLFLNKPIIYYIPDINEYTKQCRGFYRPYEELTAGTYVKTETELLQAMQEVINGIDEFKIQRKLLMDKMFVYQDGKNCERIVNYIIGLGN